MRLVLWADNDAASQEAQIRELLAAEVDALVVAPVDVYSLRKVLRRQKNSLYRYFPRMI